MHPPKSFTLRFVLAYIIICFAAHLSVTCAQEQKKTEQNPSSTADDVVRIKTELVQTDVSVVDRQGRFVEGLRPEQFELSVDGKARVISFFERVGMETGAEGNQAATGMRSNERAPTARDTQSAPAIEKRGRVVLFFIDDLHLSPENLIRARKSLLQFIDNRMEQDDQAAIVSTSGQVGFLQQLTDNKAVLREAASRLSNRRNAETYAGKVQISEYDATQVAEHFNRELFRYLVEATAAEYQTDEVTAANMVINRVHQIGMQSRTATIGTLNALTGLMRSSAPLPGRKVVFFITDGFVADPRASNVLEMLRQVTKTAAQVGAVIYSVDARGTFGNPSTDASRNDYPDFTGSVSRDLLGETIATQEPLQILAADTGGRAFLNSNSFDDSFTRALDDSSSYYLLAWRPEAEEQYGGKTRVEVGIKGRPDLKVRVRRGFIEAPIVSSSSKRRETTRRTPEDELRSALGSLYPVRALPVSLSVGYASKQAGGAALLNVSMQIDTLALNLDPSDKARNAEVDVLGVALDDRGAIASFKQKLTIAPESIGQGRRKVVVWNQQLAVAPGLYQVRVAARERSSGRMGSAMQWIEVPDFTAGRFQMSSIFLGEREAQGAASEKSLSAPRPITVNASRRFARSSVLRFQIYIYNAAHDAAPPNIEIEGRVLRNGRPVILIPPANVPSNTASDLTRLPYWAEIALDQLPAGKYLLQVTATDRATKASVTQQTSFMIE
ncbi:MAG TPA: VWA domain-containing protein [Pyrinomonadaceae bacterium]